MRRLGKALRSSSKSAAKSDADEGDCEYDSDVPIEDAREKRWASESTGAGCGDSESDDAPRRRTVPQKATSPEKTMTKKAAKKTAAAAAPRRGRRGSLSLAAPES